MGTLRKMNDKEVKGNKTKRVKGRKGRKGRKGKERKNQEIRNEKIPRRQDKKIGTR
jgi:hypothetical protein